MVVLAMVVEPEFSSDASCTVVVCYAGGVGLNAEVWALTTLLTVFFAAAVWECHRMKFSFTLK